MNYEECLLYLDRVQNLGIKFGLDNVRTILSSFGDPHLSYPSLLVAGSNGKGSVCAMLSHALSAHGFRIGLYTSPHLVHVRERIRSQHTPISEKSFTHHLNCLRTRIEELIEAKELLSPPTYFEMLSCLAFIYFAEDEVDMAVLEVGMGGRFDATNVAQPLVTTITTISEEHQKFLGDTPAQIASEKAGIIKTGIPVVCGVEEKESFETIRLRARELKAPFISAFNEGRHLVLVKSGAHHTFSYKFDGHEYLFTPSLRGAHQGRNAAIAIAVLEQLDRHWKKLDRDTIIHSLENTSWPGRLEVISECPFVLVDGAHNEEGARALSEYVEEFVPKPLTLIFAVMRDKKIGNLANILFPLAERVILTRFPYHKAADPEDVLEKAQAYQDRIYLEPDVEMAVKIALEEATTGGAVCVAGSLFLVGELKKIFPTPNAD
ncbi:bifunctional folylpolyglutamate synthase/dihydrofolate synthase [Acidobacteriota bacterium]